MKPTYSPTRCSIVPAFSDGTKGNLVEEKHFLIVKSVSKSDTEIQDGSKDLIAQTDFDCCPSNISHSESVCPPPNEQGEGNPSRFNSNLKEQEFSNSKMAFLLVVVTVVAMVGGKCVGAMTMQMCLVLTANSSYNDINCNSSQYAGTFNRYFAATRVHSQ